MATTALGRRTPLLARLGVGAKLMLLVLLPVAVLLGVTIAGSVTAWRNASSLSDFRGATEQSFVATDLSTALADERTVSALTILHPGAASLEQLRAARAGVDAALDRGSRHAAEWTGPVDLGGRLDAVRRQLNAARVQATSGSLTAPASADAYSAIVRDVLRTMRELDAAGPTRLSARAADAYVAIVEAIEAAERERVDVAALIATPADPDAASSAVRWNVLETAELDAFRENAGGSLAADLEAVLFSPPGVTVTAVRDDLNSNTLGALQELSVSGWLDASGTRIASLRVLAAGARANLTAAASNDLAAARADGFRDLGILLAVLLVVTGLGLALRRSITVPLREVSEGARNLSSGKLAFDIGYSGRDEIGHVAAAFHDLHVTVERLAGEIREMTAAVRDNRLGHRAEVAAFEGTWSQLLAGVNDTMAAFADVEGRRERAERQLGDFFELSLDLLCIADLDGHFTRINQAFERTLGYTNAELMSRPFTEFVHPDDRARTLEAFHTHKLGQDVSEFETRYLCSDGRVRWLQWSARAVLAEGLVYAVGRDVTQRRRSENQQAALRRVATLVAEGASPAETFAAITAEVGRVLGTDHTSLIRYDPDGEATVVGAWTSTGRVPPVPVGSRVPPGGRNMATLVLETGRPARIDDYADTSGHAADIARRWGIRSAVGVPITVEGRLWGVMNAVSTREQRLPTDAEARLADFTELVATAVANAQARLELRGFAAEQAALRRVATLVARAAPPEEVFAAVTTEVRRLLAVDLTAMGRYDPDSTVTYVGWSTTGDKGAAGVRVPLGGRNMVTLVFETGRPARIDDYSTASGPSADLVRGFRTRAGVGVPISVEGRLWGVMMAMRREQPLPADTEARLADFTELVATALANAENQAQLTASRARIMAAADQARRRIERDLHDGAQQRLVSLALHLRVVQAAVPPQAIELAAQFDGLADEVTTALDELRELARGIHPAALAEGGLRPALKGLARRSGVPVELDVRVDGRLPEQIETAAYYIVSEALTNAAKHAHASVVHVKADTVEGDGGSVLRVCVRDEGRGGANFAGGSGLFGLKDRVEALGGTIKIESPPGKGTALRATVPIRGGLGIHSST